MVPRVPSRSPHGGSNPILTFGCFVMTVACVVTYSNAVTGAQLASHEFWTYLETNDLRVKVASVEGFKGASTCC